MADLESLRALSRDLRIRIIENSHKTGTPHLGSCLSCADILTAAYFEFLQIDPRNPRA
jgi:transketolase